MSAQNDSRGYSRRERRCPASDPDAEMSLRMRFWRLGNYNKKTEVAGEVAEWLMAPVLKTGIPERVSGVRIPHSPPRSLKGREIAWNALEFARPHFQSGPPKTEGSECGELGVSICLIRRC